MGRRVCKDKDYQNQVKFATDSISWVGLEFLISPLKMVDPVQFYSDICAPIDSRPPLGERLGPVGQEHDGEGSLPSKPAATGGAISKLASVGRPAPPYNSARKPSICEFEDDVFQDDSPPDPGRHTFSTPKHPKMHTPTFDLSKVVKPSHNMDLSDSEVPDCRLKLKTAGNRVYRLASFSTPHSSKFPPPPPPLPEITLPEFQSPSHHPPPPFSRTDTTLPKPIRKNSGAVPRSPLTSPTPVDCSLQVSRQPHGSPLGLVVKSQESPNPLQFNHSTLEISQRARDKSNSAVDWTKLP